MNNDFTLILSLFSLGFFGGFSHCIGMCGPFVLTQVGNRLNQTSLENFSRFKKLKNLALISYHLGRITTYSCIGFFCSFITKNIENVIELKIISASSMIIGALVFAFLIFDKNPQNLLSFLGKFRLRFKSQFLEKMVSFFSEKIILLFKNSQGLQGFLLGIILGFIPCGLLYSAFLISGSFSSPFLAALGMIFFGLGTFPSLFMTACGSRILTKIPEFKFIAKTVMLFNFIALVLMATKLIG